MYFQIISFELIIIVVVISIILLLVSTYLELRNKPRKPEYETKELLECVKCKYRIISDFEPGDFVSMYKSKCPKCGDRMRVKAIYNVEKTIKHI